VSAKMEVMELLENVCPSTAYYIRYFLIFFCTSHTSPPMFCYIFTGACVCLHRTVRRGFFSSLFVNVPMSHPSVYTCFHQMVV